MSKSKTKTMSQESTETSSFQYTEQQVLMLMCLDKLQADTSLLERKLEPYWTATCKALSNTFLSLTTTKTPGVDLNGYELALADKKGKSCSTKQWYSTSLRSPLRQDLYDTDFPKGLSTAVSFVATDELIARTRKIRIYPKSKTRAKQYLGLSRYWFNQAIEYLRKPNTKATLKELRALQDPEQHPPWAFACPQRIREHAFADAANAVKNAKVKYKKSGVFQQVSFRRKKSPKQRFGFDKKSLKETFCFSNKKGAQYQIDFLASESFKKDSEGTKIIRENGRWFLSIPQKRRVKVPESQRLPCVAIDPGVRTFASFYSPWMTGHFGASDFGRIHRLCQHLDDLISRTSKVKSKKKGSMRKAQRRMRWKIKDLINDLHKKVAHFLVTRFNVILLPTFETSQMVSKLRSKTARAMLSWAHYRFKAFLKAKAEEYSALVVDTCEAYTSKTCSYCGIVQNIGSKKIMSCQTCCVQTDRDSNGARGVMLRALSVSTSLHVTMMRAISNVCC